MANGDSSNMIEAVMASSRAGSLGEVIFDSLAIFGRIASQNQKKQLFTGLAFKFIFKNHIQISRKHFSLKNCLVEFLLKLAETQL
jgi:hypothetical protein